MHSLPPCHSDKRRTRSLPFCLPIAPLGRAWLQPCRQAGPFYSPRERLLTRTAPPNRRSRTVMLRKRSRSLSDSRRRIYAFASILSFRQAKDEESAFLFADCAFGKGIASATPPSRSFLLPEGAPARKDRAAKSSP